MSQADGSRLHTGGKPLSGKRIMVTRSRHQAQEFVRKIEALGGEAYSFPLVKMIPPRDSGPLDEALHRLERFDWVVFTSPNGVRFFYERMIALGVDSARLRAKLAAVGPKTAAELEEKGWPVAVVAGEYVGEGLLQSLSGELQAGEKVLLPRADIARKTLPEELRRLGLDVTEVDAYETVPDGENAEEAASLLKQKRIDIVTFTSSSTVKHFIEAMAPYGLPELLEGVQIACIGPVTADTARELGLTVHVMAKEYTVEGLLDALVAKWGGVHDGSHI
jgi:uroporphyrinogen-III synthase